jgi:hypothetical protein
VVLTRKSWNSTWSGRDRLELGRRMTDGVMVSFAIFTAVSLFQDYEVLTARREHELERAFPSTFTVCVSCPAHATASSLRRNLVATI